MRSAHAMADAADPVAELVRGLGPEPMAAVFLFVSPAAPFDGVVASAQAALAPARVIACTTAGEISSEGYGEDTIVAVGLPATLFAVDTMLVDLDRIEQQELIGELIRTRSALAREAPLWPHEFAFLIVDGLSLKEDELTAALAPGLGPLPMFGGSSGDGTRFETTRIALDGQSHDNAAVLTVVRTACPVRVFSLDHLRPTKRRMVVTRADPARRIVHGINGEPAAREYARILGKDPEKLSPTTFAAHPVVVRIGATHHVRSIQSVTDAGELVFFSAIDEGLVLNLADAEPMTDHLDAGLTALGMEHGRAGPAFTPPDSILACDCMLRRLEASEKQMGRAISEILRRHNVVGFSTYGEQLGAMHVNQTMTGVAIFAPPADDGDDDSDAGSGPVPSRRR
ncbi:GfdT protein [Brevirhabdus pacifica]|uniref:GfdT protein n=3 Tax=Brevirhabdus pacifica TaxID=1267768 RepID=A0A1U7DLT3_9RHOB|nr:GfdT protein [Brevirhabdus pacifica]